MKRKPYSAKHKGAGCTKSLSADRALIDYIQSGADAKKRNWSVEAVELLEHGIAARDGESGAKALVKNRSNQVKA